MLSELTCRPCYRRCTERHAATRLIARVRACGAPWPFGAPADEPAQIARQNFRWEEDLALGPCSGSVPSAHRRATVRAKHTYSLERCARSLAPHTYAAPARALPSASAQRLRAVCNRRPRELRAFDVSVLNALGVARAAAHRAHHLARRGSCALATDPEAPRRQLAQGELRFRPNESPPTPASIAVRLRCAMVRGSKSQAACARRLPGDP